MGQDPYEIRQEIEETRSRMGDTVDAIGYKTDVRARTGDYVSEKKDAIAGKKDELVSRVSGGVPDREQAKQQARRTKGMAEQNPLGLAVAGAALGFLAGLAFPSTRAEDERLGSVADDLKERARDTGQEAFERGKHVAQEAGQSAMETARERGREEGQELSSTLKENAQEARSSTSPGGS